MTPNRYIVQAYDLPGIWYNTEIEAMETGRNVFVWERWPDGWLGKLAEYEPSDLVFVEPETNTELVQLHVELDLSVFCSGQVDMFTDRTDDLPLFSGTAPRAQVRPFVETPAPPKQLGLF